MYIVCMYGSWQIRVRYWDNCIFQEHGFLCTERIVVCFLGDFDAHFDLVYGT